jgi:hypothetical protein
MSEVLDLLEADRAVRQTIVLMFHAFDEADWQTMHACLSTDFSTSVSADRSVVSSNLPASEAAVTIQGADMMVSVMKDLAAQTEAAGIKVMHIPGNLIVTVGAEEAQVSAFQTAYRYRVGEVSSPLSKSGARAAFRLRRENGFWKVVSFETVRVWLEGEPY